MKTNKDRGIFEASELPLNEKVYLKKDFLGWRNVNPIRNEDNSINYINLIFGGYRSFLSLLFILILIAIFFYGFYEAVNSMRAIVEDPCKACNLASYKSIPEEILKNSEPINVQKYRPING